MVTWKCGSLKSLLLMLHHLHWGWSTTVPMAVANCRALSTDNHSIPEGDTLIFILISNQDIYVSTKVILVLERMYQWKQFSRSEHREGKKQFIQSETAFIQRNWGTSQSTTFPRETPLVTKSPSSIVLAEEREALSATRLCSGVLGLVRELGLMSAKMTWR